ncbi:MAG: ROK family protein [Actinobacteria bacterium]|nr:ROK family protein [Actinomycetota bacterium]
MSAEMGGAAPATGHPGVDVGVGESAPGSEPVAGEKRSADDVLTLAIDIGGTGLKASVLDTKGKMVADRVRVETKYPCPPQSMIDALAELVRPLPSYDRVSAGFPGVVRKGRILTAPHFVTKSGPGSQEVPELVKQWDRFDLAGALASRLGKPTRVANDADLQGAAVVEGQGLELVITLGTGFGSGLFYDGRLMPHLEIAHQPFRKGKTYNEELGDVALKRVGPKKWNKRLAQAIENMVVLLRYDKLYLGGGNARHVTLDLGDKATIVDNSAGILGGIWLWDDRRGME